MRPHPLNTFIFSTEARTCNFLLFHSKQYNLESMIENNGVELERNFSNYLQV